MAMRRQHDQICSLVLNDSMNDGTSFTQFRERLHMFARELIESELP
jgi:hypothetical protein